MSKLCPLKMSNAQLAKEMKEDVNAFELMNCDEDNCEWWIVHADNQYSRCAIPQLSITLIDMQVVRLTEYIKGGR